VLLIANYLFYIYWDYRFSFLLILITCVDFFVGKAIYSTSSIVQKRRYLLISLFSLLGVLFFFKYFNFFVDSSIGMAKLFGVEYDFLHLNLLLPLGLSFYIFRSLTYTIDIYLEKAEPTGSIINYAVYLSFFPQLLSGPIERASKLLPQIESSQSPNKTQIQQGFALLTLGMLKKVLIGDASGRMVDQIFAQPQYYTSSEMLMGLVLFSIQIYADFSGYSDISKGISKFMGFETMNNFNQPYLSRNITEFWRRWHISLSTWFNDYLFTPLNMNLRRLNKIGAIISIFTTFLLCGLWHGASWTFIFWGGLHGLLLSIHWMLFGKKGYQLIINMMILSDFAILLVR